MAGPTTETTMAPVATQKLKLTRSLVSKTVELYASAKVLIPDFAKPITEKLEDVTDKAINAGMNALQIEKKDVDLLIERIDERIDERVTPLIDENSKKVAELRASIEENVSANVDGILANTEKAIDFVLPTTENSEEGETDSDLFMEPVDSEDEEPNTGNKKKIITTKYVQNRLYGMQAKVSNRCKRRALQGLTELRLRSVQLVHVDLIKYAEDFLDSEQAKKTFTQVNEKVTEYYTVSQELVTKTIATTSDRVNGIVKDVVVKPAVSFYEKATDLYVQLEAEFKSRAEELRSSDYLQKLEATLKDDWQTKLVKPSEELFVFLKEEWENIRQESLGVNPTDAVTADSDAEKTLQLNLLVSAVQKRIELAWSKIVLAVEKYNKDAVVVTEAPSEQ